MLIIKKWLKKVEAQVMPLARRMQRTLFSERGVHQIMKYKD